MAPKLKTYYKSLSAYIKFQNLISESASVSDKYFATLADFTLASSDKFNQYRLTFIDLPGLLQTVLLTLHGP